MSVRVYEEFSRYYDAMMHDVDYARWVAYLHEILGAYGAKTVMDVACGTANITIPLAELGYQMTGVDRSADMLNIAQQKARTAGIQIPFVCQDMLDLSVHRPADAIVCCCDGVNYLTSAADVRAFFDACHASLRGGGVLLFDVSSAYKLEHVLGDNTFTEITDAYAYIWRNRFDASARLTQMDVCFFVNNGNTYDRFTERHIQRAHTADELAQTAHDAGFAVKGIYAAFSLRKPSANCERIQFVLEKE